MEDICINSTDNFDFYGWMLPKGVVYGKDLQQVPFVCTHFARIPDTNKINVPFIWHYKQSKGKWKIVETNGALIRALSLLFISNDLNDTSIETLPPNLPSDFNFDEESRKRMKQSKNKRKPSNSPARPKKTKHSHDNSNKLIARESPIYKSSSCIYCGNRAEPGMLYCYNCFNQHIRKH